MAIMVLAVLTRVMQERRLFKQLFISCLVPNLPHKVCLQHKASYQSHPASSPTAVMGFVGLVDPTFFGGVLLVRRMK